MTTYEYLLQKYGTTLTFEQAAEELGLYWQTVFYMKGGDEGIDSLWKVKGIADEERSVKL